MSVEWFQRRAGEHVAEGTSDPSMTLIGSGTPEWVRLPEELGGTTLRVEKSFVAACPAAEVCADCRHLHLANRYGVAECLSHGFLWYRRRA